MNEAERQEIHELITKATDGDRSAAPMIEEIVLGFERAGLTNDTVYVMDRLSLMGLADAHHRILERLQSNSVSRTDDRPPWVA